MSVVSKIRRFVMGELANSGLLDIYVTYWLELENSFLDAAERVNENLLEKFIVDYLTIQNNGIIPKKEQLFMNFVDFYRKASRFQKKDTKALSFALIYSFQRLFYQKKEVNSRKLHSLCQIYFITIFHFSHMYNHYFLILVQ